MQFLTTSRRRALLARALPLRSMMAAGERIACQFNQGRTFTPGWGGMGAPSPALRGQGSRLQELMLEEYYGVFSHPLVLADRLQRALRSPRSRS